MIITKKEFENIRNKPQGQYFQQLVDFGQRTVGVKRGANQAIIEESLVLDLGQKVKEDFCYILDERGLTKLAFFSPETNRFYKLVPTGDWPTVAIGSVPMHRRSSPKKDTENKIEFAKPRGYVLDTCMCLGYTAFAASRLAHKVITFEKDNIVYDIARMNPLSECLFKARNIEIRREDASEGIKQFPGEYFDCVIHDPPTLKLAGELFSNEFYSQVKRVLRPKAKFFHYTPLYKIKQGFKLSDSIKKRLAKQGFRNIAYSEAACGLLCEK
ncbi:MAG: MnmC family methyltransferase [Candidatus Omnitrophica bacterium]|nr:MnmC family methyltransferase [Candidatus Omnitrophota bacterium]MDD5430264.1 MnmC family methyltransferase [Candidatus Omnitrophota bacterium]